MAVAEIISILAAPLFAGLIIVLTHVTFGREVLKRGIIFIDLTIAQVAAVGMIIISVVWHEPPNIAVQLAAVGSALAVSLLLALAEKHWPDTQEALIGAVYVLAASVVIILLADNPHGNERLNSLLSGQILWVSWTDLLPVILLYAAVLTAWHFLKKQHRFWFYLLFALIVTSSVQLVGLYLVFATLVIPALFQRLTATSNFLSYTLAVLAYIVGLSMSFLFDLPAGPMVVIALVATGSTAFLFKSRP